MTPPDEPQRLLNQARAELREFDTWAEINHPWLCVGLREGDKEAEHAYMVALDAWLARGRRPTPSPNPD